MDFFRRVHDRVNNTVMYRYTYSAFLPPHLVVVVQELIP